MSRIVVKVGSNVLTRADGMPNITNMSLLADQIAYLREKGHEIILISSGAVACGRGAVSPKKELDAVAQRQLYSAVGQIRLINIYHQLFNAYGIVVGQVLTQKENFSSRTAYLNQRGCILTMLENSVLPILNENDTASLSELMFTDNDELSGLVATMVSADSLIILSNVDGIFAGSPGNNDVELIREVSSVAEVEKFISATKSGFGRGGMSTKCKIASKVASEGVNVIIAKGDRHNVLIDVIENPEAVPHTVFKASQQGVTTVKRWIAHSGSFSKGVLVVNDGAEELLRSDSPVSLLPIGIIKVDGQWEVGDIVSVKNAQGHLIAIGKAAMNSNEAVDSMGEKGHRPIIHYDYLYIE